MKATTNYHITDHRVEVAARKRAQMRKRLLEATLSAFSDERLRSPVIEDVVKLAGVSRGTFYLHFQSLDEALQALARAQSDEMTKNSLALYDLLKEPWQRFAVGFRLFLKRAQQDVVWASFVTRSFSNTDRLLVTALMKEDLKKGKACGHFNFGNLEVALDFMTSASLSGIRAMGQGVSNPTLYIEDAVCMALHALSCPPEVREKALKFSKDYLADWCLQSGADDLPFV